MPRHFERLIAIACLALSACTPSPITPLPPGLPLALSTEKADATNAGRVQSIAICPTDRNRALVAMEFGGLWQTFSGGNSWFRVHSLPAVFVSDVEYGAGGRTVVAAVQRDNGTVNGGGIYVSRTSGDSWSRPPTGAVPPATLRGSANSVSHAPDERGLWYVGTSYGVATSRDDGAAWTHARLGPVQAVLAMPNGTVLAMTGSAILRSDDRGATWRIVIADDFTWESFSEPPRGGNKMDRSPYAPWAFIFKVYKQDTPSRKGFGALWFYELDTETKTLLPLPQGRARGPFVRVSKDLEFGGQHITVWVGEGWDGYYVTREDAASIRAIRSDTEWDDWVSFNTGAGIHADMGDLGLDSEFQPVLLGSDGGIFRPRPNAPHKWMSAAVPGSGMNSLQISDLAGTNVGQSNGTTKIVLYFATQDNKIWASPNGGNTWPAKDSQEGFRLEALPYARAGEPVTVAYTRVGSGEYPMRFSGIALSNQRDIPNLDENGLALDGHIDTDKNPLDRLEGPFLVYQQTGSGVDSTWVRLRWRRNVAGREVYVSFNSGKRWRKVADVNLDPKGEIKVASGLIGWLPVRTTGGRIGLIPLTPVHSYLDRAIQTYDDSDVVLLPNNGSLGLRATMFDTHAVFGVHPLDWKFLIAPDVVANDVKVSRDGGATWHTDPALTQQVLRGGELKLADGDSPYRMQVTTIAFEPPPPSTARYGNRIFVGTRDAGIVCSADARHWRTIKDSDKIKYITGFHFRPDGGVYVSSYGHGLWYVKPASGCPAAYDLPWDQKPRPPVVAAPAPELDAIARAAARPARPRGIADPDSPKLFLAGSISGSGVAVVASDNFLNISGRGFPARDEIALTSRDSDFLKQTVTSDENGRFSLSIALPNDLPFGAFVIEATSYGAASPIAAGFVKALTDEREAADYERDPDQEPD